MEVKQNRKILRRQATDLVKGKSSESYQIEKPKYEVYLQIKINQEDIRKICPFKSEKFWSNCSLNRECITAERKRYIVKATSTEQHQNIMQLAAIYSIPCKVSEKCPSLSMYNSTKRLVYLAVRYKE